MTTFTISSEVADQLLTEGTVHIAVQGERYWPTRADYEDGTKQQSLRPPPVLEGLVSQVCETCDGDPSAEDHRCVKSMVVPGLDIREPGQHCDCSFENDICHWCGIEWFGDGEYNCPDCVDGRELLTLQRECDHLIVKTWGLGDQCIRCLGDGVVPVPGRWKVEALLPVRDVLDPIDDLDEVVLDRSGGTWHKGKSIDVLGTPEPGWFVVTLEAVAA